MAPLRVITVDDEPLARERVSTLVQSAKDLELVGEANNGVEALDLITRLVPDLLFIDVEMPELSGFGVIAALEPGRVPAVIFITAYEQYALKAFEVGAIDYLHKPVTQARFTAAVARAIDRLEARSIADKRALVAQSAKADEARGTRKRFVVKGANAHYLVPVEQIDWIDSADNYLRLHAGKRIHLSRGTMKDAEAELDPARFVRIHRSAIVAVDRIAAIRSRRSGGHVLELQTGERLRASRQYADRLRLLLRQT